MNQYILDRMDFSKITRFSDNYVALAGKPGTGKTTSLRNLPPEHTMFITPGKSVALQGYTPLVNGEGNYMVQPDVTKVYPIIKAVSDQMPHVKFLVLEDITHWMSNETQSHEFVRKGKTKESFSRFDEYAFNVFHTIITQIKNGYAAGELRPDLLIISVFHTRLGDDGEVELETGIGTKLQRLQIPSYFNIITGTSLQRTGTNLDYTLQVKGDSEKSIFRTPFGMFDEMFIESDFMHIINKIAIQ